MDTEILVAGFLAAAVRVATPLMLAATGETITERSGVINLGLEGTMLAGALAATMGATAWGPWSGVACAILAGMLLAAVFALLAVGARADQIITGTAITLAAVGLTGTIYRQAYGAAGAGLSIPTLKSVAIPGLSQIPVLGTALFDQPAPTYLALLSMPIVWWVLFRTRLGLALRATGEGAAMARAAGVRTRLIRTGATVVGGGFAGLAGASLVLAQVGSFTEGMTAGRGYVAIAIVVLGRWHPGGIALGALLFGAATALQYLLQTLGLDAPYQLFLMLPYLLTLLALAGAVGRVRAPADLGR
ncbi:MAG: ral nucleoside transport system permease protein [Gemmatimonadales bacterium]|jgi:simple sugar transport system permease protein|nr:ral nucleoside transport system permease protein [Gemmatimonadales bacterium]